ncbi:thiol:disulfide interchange protein TlpA [Jiella mangrovi]|uniref:TlpA family protein disulfide reductase n=1 Tax=Jiella mangrovi TaxID=2821407 RepID=A0ABS4BBD9_9HYPH|nr:TlpA disulfide reductase family protein [Jiella mangrovi]MBP0614068.1 TlpA family protein disulfide reductase [Jiella mangrovi]
MTADEPKRFDKRLLAIAGLALVVGIVAGLGVLYVTESGSGNAVASSCPSSDAFTTAVDAHATGEVAAVRALDTPFDARAITFKDGDGRDVSLADFSGKTLLVNVWATWCVPCRAEMPALDALERQEGGEDFAVVPINVDIGDAEKPKKFYAETKLESLPLYHDGSLATFNDLKSKGVTLGLPVSLLVSPDGCARAVVAGPAEWASPDAIRLIEAVKQGAAGNAGNESAARIDVAPIQFAEVEKGA